jgi:hypothetical protein
MFVSIALHDHAAQKDQPARFVHLLDYGIQRLADSAAANELSAKLERYRKAGVERTELVGCGK